MQEEQIEQLENLRSMRERLTELEIDYWESFSNFATWQSWLVLAMVVVPLIILFFTIDRQKTLLIGFFGFNYHVWFMYGNKIGIKLGLWEYPYQVVPFLQSFALDAALIPIVYMMFYQWTLKNEKSIYLYAILLSAVFAFVLKPVLVAIDLFHMFYWVNYFHLFLFYYLFFFISIVITNLFVWLQKKA